MVVRLLVARILAGLMAVAPAVAQSVAPVMAGPWPREVGAVFLSLSREQSRDGLDYSSIYGEYGLGPLLTLGGELGQTRGESNALIWLQWARDPGRGANRWATSLGLGVIRREGSFHPVGQLALHWGRGFDSLRVLKSLPGGGWIAADLRTKISTRLTSGDIHTPGAETRITYLTPQSVTKLDLTLGWNARDRLKLIGQLQLEHRDDGSQSRLALSAVQDIMGPLQLELGAIAPLDGRGEPALKLGVWLDF